MANTLIVTVQDVINFNEMSAKTNPDSIQQRIPLAKSYVDGQLDDAYDPTLHGKSAEYLAAIKTYVFYSYIDRPSFVSLVGIGQLKEDTVDKVYMTPYDIQKKKDSLLSEVNNYIAIVKKAMDAVALIVTSDNIQQVGNAIYSIGCGGNSDYKTNYGLGMKQDDEDLREVLPNVE